MAALCSAPIVWWRKPYVGLDGHGTSLKRCEGSPESSEVSALGKLSVFSKQQLGHTECPLSRILRGMDNKPFTPNIV